MDEERPLLSRDRGAVRVLTLNRPDKKNAFNGAMARALDVALAEAATDDSVHVAVVHAAGDDFCSGADVNLFLALGRGERDEAMAVGRLHRVLRAFPKPLVAAVHGKAVGMGVTMLPYFDVVYAADDASFTTPFVRLGLIQELGSSYNLPRLIGRQRASELIFGARPIDASTALAWGLVNRVVPRGAMLDIVLDLAAEYAQHPPTALAEAKALLRFGEEAAFEATLEREDAALERFYGGPDNLRAIEAFLASRRG